MDHFIEWFNQNVEPINRRLDEILVTRPTRIPVKNGMDDQELIEEFFKRYYNHEDSSFREEADMYEAFLDDRKAASSWEDPIDLSDKPF
jgi:hypothetical protein